MCVCIKARNAAGERVCPVVAAAVESAYPSQRGLGVGAGFSVKGECPWGKCHAQQKMEMSKEGAASSDEVATTMSSPWGVQRWEAQLSDEAKEK